MDEQELFALVRKNYGEANREYLKQQVMAAVSHMKLPSRKETMDGLLDWIVEGCFGMNDRYRLFIYSSLALLKEQEPRVIYDASEIKLDTVYWMEKKNIVTPWPVAMKMYSQRFPEQLEFEDYYGERWLVSRFLVGKEGWRLWTARPTDEQRREAAWHA